MCKKFFLLFLLAVFLLVPTAQAKKIIWVAQDWDANNDGINDSNEWVVKLQAEGYEVDFQTDGHWNNITDAMVTELNTADLVIIGGNIQSGEFGSDAAEAARWNSVAVPMLSCNCYLLRSTRWKWINNGNDIPLNNGDQGAPLMVAVAPSHPVFYGVTLDANKKVDAIDETLGSGNASFIGTADVGNGTLIAKADGNEWLWIAEWKKGVEFYNGSGYYATDHRMYISIGYHEDQTAPTYASRGYNLTDEGWEIFLNTVQYMLGESVNPGKARSPSPANGETDVFTNPELSWKSGAYVVSQNGSHNIYLGTDFNDVNEATIDDQRGVLLIQGLDPGVNSYMPGELEYGTEYFWRVDEVNGTSSPGTNVGKVWSFTTEPVALNMPFENITVTARNTVRNNDPNDTVNGKGLDPNHPDQHSNNSGSWYTTILDANGTWIQYEFDKEYKLNEMLVWNYNHKILKFYGMKSVRIEYSLDGVAWTEFTDVNEFNQATGSETYTYNTIVPFDGIVTKFVRITGLTSYNAGSSIGLSEVRFTYIPVRARIPSPKDGATDIEVDAVLSWRDGREALSHKVYISTDEDAVTNGTAPSHTASDGSYSPALNLGRTYYWRVDAINNSMDPSVWSTDTWSFSTIEYITIDDFEDYNDEPDFEIWQTWWDGFETAGNGSQMGHNPPPYSETTIVAPGSEQSAPVYYANYKTGTSKADNSEVERDFGSAQNWTTNGADTLRLFYRGSAVTFQEAPDGSIAMSGEGADIGGATDEFRFVYKTLKNNGSITCRIDGVQNTNANAEAGIMIRNTIDANSAQAMAVLRPNRAVSFQRRSQKGGTTDGTEVANVGNPHWVRITRVGKKFTAEHSFDAVTWTTFNQDANVPSDVEIEMGSDVLIGFVVSSHVADVLCAAAFSEISTTGNVSGSWQVADIGDEDQADGVNTLDKLYVALADSSGGIKRVYAPANAVGNGAWTEWKIPYTDFSGVNMSKIKKIAIGVGDESNPLNGEGLIYIDDIAIGHVLD